MTGDVEGRRWFHQPVYNGHGELVHDFIADGDGNVVAEVHDPKDAPVIAAAPDLLAALKSARDALHQHYIDWDGEPEDAVPLQLARSECDAAIAKASTTGEG